jgi:hypothetical protein
MIVIIFAAFTAIKSNERLLGPSAMSLSPHQGPHPSLIIGKLIYITNSMELSPS